MSFTAEEFEPPDPTATPAVTAKAGSKPPGGGAPGAPPGGGGGGGPSTGGTTGGTPGGPATPPAWPEMGQAAWHGLAGEVVNTMLPQTEADPVALLMQYLVYFGNATGRGPHYLVERSKHFANLFVVLAGATAKARKGLSKDRITEFFKLVDRAWVGSCIRGGLSSGEGVIHAIRDAAMGMKKGVLQVIDPGIDDKRLLLNESEFFAALEVMRREGNIVSRIIRDAWDCLEHLETMTKHSPTHATKAYISIVGHITIDEYRKRLEQTSMANGYANRFLNACVRRSKMLPFGGDPVDETELAARTRAMLDKARGFEQVTMTDAAMDLWEKVYPQLSGEVDGLLGALTARAEAQTIRISLLYALIDGKDQIDRVHLEAGLAVWAYCDASTRLIFGDVTGDLAADEMLDVLRCAGTTGITRTELYRHFGGHRRSSDIGQALILLAKQNRARSVTTPPTSKRGGRPIETWFAI